MGIELDKLDNKQLKIVESLMEKSEDKIKQDDRRIDLTDRRFGEWKVLKYAGHKKWICICSCGTIKSILGTELRSGKSTSCGHGRQAEDIVGKTFGYWEVIEKVTSKLYKCKCHCGCNEVIKNINAYDLKSGKSTSCGYNTTRKESIIGKKFNHWTVLEKLTNGKYRCECDCEEHNIGEIKRSDLISGKSKSCGHNTNKLVDLTGQRFGYWEVLKHVGYGRWLCRCSCEAATTKVIRHTELINGDSTSCGCKRAEQFRETMMNKYGDTSILKVENPRTQEQHSMIESKQSLIEVIQNNFTEKPSIYKLSCLLGITYSATAKLIHQYSLEEYTSIYELTRSKYEDEIIQYINSLNQNIEIKTSDREVLHGEELDIYIPSAKLAIEFNGTYWHSHLFKDKKYHQNKTIECAKQGIRLIHIFEYEWINIEKQQILKWIISDALYKKENKQIIYARQCKVIEIQSNDEIKQFLNTNHLQGYIPSSISFGIYYKSELLGVMTFGKPRYSNNYEYELLRLSYKIGINVVGGTNKLFKSFIESYKPSSIISYCDISKFNGGVYSKLGFMTDTKSITSPNYMWINTSTQDIKPRYQTMKHKLLKHGLGTPSMTENEIMESLGYIKVYDCGNLRFEWLKEKQ